MSALKVCLAGPSSELERVCDWALKLESTGLIELTYRWGDAVRKHGVGRDKELTVEQQRELAWCLWPNGHSVGVPIEFGFAYAACVPIVVSGWSADSCIFTALATQRLASDVDAFEVVLQTARAQKQLLLAGGCPRGEVP